MRLKPGRPSLTPYAHRFDVPTASAESVLTVAWAGVTTLLIDDGESALLTDGFFSRPGLPGQLGLQPEHHLVDYWTETVRTVGARRVVLTHWDDFFRPLHKPLRALPYAADDLDVSLRVLTRLAETDGIPLHLPTLWQRADPWR